MIGIDRYNNGQKIAVRPENARRDAFDCPKIDNLREAVSDAQKFEAYLLDTLKIDKNNVLILLDEHATRKNIIDALKKLAENDKIKKDDSIFIYYAGHGAQALPPKRLAGVPGCPEYVELLIPYDYINNSTDYRRMGIPDYTLAALLDKISKEKGNKIVCNILSTLRPNLTP